MTELAYDNYLSVWSSSVVDEVYYDSHTERMVVALVNGTLCGYEDVPLSVFNTLKAVVDNGESVGHYWNTFIKNDYKGFSTDDLEFVDDRHKLTAGTIKTESSFFFNGAITNSVPLDVAAPQQKPSKVNYIVLYEQQDSGDVFDLPVAANSEEDALNAFADIAYRAGWIQAKVLGVTHLL